MLPLLLISLTGLWYVAASAAEPATPVGLPHERTARFLGVDTCGSTECHGSREPWRNATVAMKERTIWEAHDRHAKAFSSLSSTAGQQIAHNLGLADAAQAADCLVCHTTYVPAAQRGAKFSLEAGVGCESCHGPGGGFLAVHMQPTATHAANVAAGLYPTNEPAARAALCLSCHQGDNVRKASHQLYGAGHPRLRFELDTYTALQPMHVNLDADYRRRKPLASHVQLWMAGQIAAGLQQAAALAGANSGRWPELALFDCHGCHRGINDDPQYRPRQGVKSGALTFNDSAFVVLRGAARIVNPTQVDALRRATRALQVSVNDPGSRASRATALKQEVEMLASALHTYHEQSSDGLAIARALVDEAKAEAPLAFTAAESVAMSLATLIAAEFDEGRLPPADFERVNATLNEIYLAVGNERTYRPTAFAKALNSIGASLGQH